MEETISAENTSERKPIGLSDRDGNAICEGDVVEAWSGSRRHIRSEYLVEWAPEWMRKAEAWSRLTHLCFHLIDKEDGRLVDDFYVQVFETEKYCRIIGHPQYKEV